MHSPRIARMPDGFEHSRSVFRRLAKTVGAELGSHEHEPDDKSGASLTTETAYIGPPRPRHLLVAISGTHGIEGYVGAACQHTLLENARACLTSGGQVGFLLVHALNAWGFHRRRRVTEENVDLNRNFVDSFSGRGAIRSRYAPYHDVLLPRDWFRAAGRLRDLRLLPKVFGPGRRRFQDALTGGQYDVPDGLFYGGKSPTRARRILEAVLQRYAAGTESLALIDIHSGLGQRGRGYALTQMPRDDSRFRQLANWLPMELASTESGQAVSSALDGTLISAVPRMVDCPVYPMVVEFGTRSPWHVLNALRADHCLARGDIASPTQRARVEHAMTSAFCPEYREWTRHTVSQFLAVWDCVRAGIERGRATVATVAEARGVQYRRAHAN